MHLFLRIRGKVSIQGEVNRFLISYPEIPKFPGGWKGKGGTMDDHGSRLYMA